MSFTAGWYIVTLQERAMTVPIMGYATEIHDIGGEGFLRLVVLGEERARHIRVGVIQSLEEIAPPGEQAGEEPPEKTLDEMLAQVRRMEEGEASRRATGEPKPGEVSAAGREARTVTVGPSLDPAPGPVPAYVSCRDCGDPIMWHGTIPGRRHCAGLNCECQNQPAQTDRFVAVPEKGTP